jgi:hypothetical protein
VPRAITIAGPPPARAPTGARVAAYKPRGVGGSRFAGDEVDAERPWQR